MNFNCYACKLDFQAERFNLAHITITCPICETYNDIAQSLARVYGKTIGEQAAKIMTALSRALDKSKDNCAPFIDAAYNRLVQLTEIV